MVSVAYRTLCNRSSVLYVLKSILMSNCTVEYADVYTDSWQYRFGIAKYTWQHMHPRPPTIKLYIFLFDDYAHRLTIIHKSISIGGLWSDLL